MQLKICVELVFGFVCLLFLFCLFVCLKQEATQLKTNRIALYHREQNLAGRLQSSLNPTE